MGLVVARPSSYQGMWEQFKVDFGKSYDSYQESEEPRFQIFRANVDKIREHNAKNLSYWLGVTQFADLTEEEFAAKHLGGYRPELHQENDVPRTPFPRVVGEVLEDSVDWVAKGGVTPVKDQKQCGSCWAFSTTGAVEGAYFVANGQLVSLSEEDLVQCDHSGDSGCQGGLMDNAFGWVKENGLCSEDDYPYTSGGGVRGKCRLPKCTPTVKVSGLTDVPANDEEALKSAVAKQPVSVAIEADKTAFQLYKGGVLDSKKCGMQLDHGVLAVGYGTEDGKDYWKVKNSWGASWGEAGYIKLVRGKNMCGIAKQASYPTGATGMGPAPGPSPPGPSPPPPGPSHYEDPKDGCMSDEEPVRVQGIPGELCSPSCTSAACPTDVPAGVTADPQCVLQDAVHHQKRCALVCQHSSQCGAGAKCHKPQPGIGLCTYEDKEQGDAEGSPLLAVSPHDEIVV